MYNWRSMTDKQREYVLNNRKLRKNPFHSLPHINEKGNFRFHITAACYEHKLIIGRDINRMSEFETLFLDRLLITNIELYAFSILPNHYHVLLETENITVTLKELFKLHQQTGFRWNAEDKTKGRRVWCNVLEHKIKSERHFWATMNYIHNNPVKHGCAEKWNDWPFTSAKDYIDSIGRQKAEEIWKEYDISRMGAWDI